MALTEQEYKDAVLIGGLAALVNGLALYITGMLRHGMPLDEGEILRHVAKMESAFVGGNARLLGTTYATDYLATLNQKETP